MLEIRQTGKLWTTAQMFIQMLTQYGQMWYKEGRGYCKVLPLGRDLVIFRTDGNLYRLFGSYSDPWAVLPITQEVEPVNRRPLSLWATILIFLDKDRGIRKLSASKNTMTSSVVEKEGGKVNAWLAGNFTTDAKDCGLCHRSPWGNMGQA